MPISQFILANGDAERGLVILVFFLLWGGGALASWIKKTKEAGIKSAALRPSAQSKRAKLQAAPLVPKQLYRRNAISPNAYPPSIIQRAQAMAPYATRRPAPGKVARKPPRLPPPLPSAGGRVVAPQRLVAPLPAPAPAAAPVTVVRRQPPEIVAGAAVMGLKADTLRQQIILAEILQPPIALRS